MSKRTVLQILKAARAKIADPKDWGKGLRGYDRSCETSCAAEAISSFGDGYYHGDSTQAFLALISAAGKPYHIQDWNDAPERTHAEVIAAFDRAIATLRQS